MPDKGEGDASQPPENAKPATPPIPRPPSPPTPQKFSPELEKIALLIRDRKTGAARVQLRNYLILHPDDVHATFLFGLTYHREQKYGQAVPHFQKALELGSDYQLTNHFYGWAQFYLGDLEASRQAFEAFLKSKGGADEPDSIFALGLIALEEDRLDDAEDFFKRSIELRAAEPEMDVKSLSKAQARLGETYERQGRLKDARAVLDTSTKLYPDHYEAFYRLYRVLLRLGENEQAQIVHGKYLESRNRVRPGTSFPE